MKIQIILSMLIVSCGSDDSQPKPNDSLPISSIIGDDQPVNGVDGENGIDGIDGKNGKDAQRIMVLGGDGYEIGQFVNANGPQITVMVGGKFISIEEIRKNGFQPELTIDNGSSPCFYESESCNGECLAHVSAPSSILLVGKNSVNSVDWEYSNNSYSIKSEWRGGQCVSRDDLMPAMRVATEMPELNYLLNIKGPLAFEAGL